ncbi:biotin/lipoyl-containing protein [Acinetobacter baumannii]
MDADKGGVVKQILVENGQAVEFGQPLFVLG